MGVILDLLKKAVQDGKAFVNGGIVEEPVTLKSIGNDKETSREDKMLAAGLAKRREKAMARCEAGLAENIKEGINLKENIEDKTVKRRKRKIPTQEVELRETNKPKKQEPEISNGEVSKGMEISD